MKQSYLVATVIVCWLGLLVWLVVGNYDFGEAPRCNCTVNIGNQTLTIEDAFEYVTKGLSAHQWLEVQQAINQSCED